MESNQDRSLIPIPSHELTVPSIGGNRILGEMVGETLALGRAEAIAQTTRFKIGEYSWREPDYRQILLWAEALKMEPLTVIEKLVAGEESEEVATRFHDGCMLSLSWNLDELPLSEFRGVEGLTVEKLRTYMRRKELILISDIHITVRLPSLSLFVLDGVHSWEIFYGTEPWQWLSKGSRRALSSIESVDEMRAAGWILDSEFLTDE